MKMYVLKCCLIIYFLNVVAGVAHSQQADSTKLGTAESNAKSNGTKDTTSVDDLSISFGEIELMEITIEAVIEKPRVSIIPKRLEPKLEEMEFLERSFIDELKKGPAKPMMVKGNMQRPDRIEQIRKTILAKKKKQKMSDK